MVRSAFPILSTPDLGRALGFYRDLLGGTVSYQFPPEGDAGYVGLDLGTSHLGIGLDTGAPTGGPFSLWVYVDDCAAAVERLRAAGVRVLEEPVAQPWGETVAKVLDPDGNTVVVGQELA